MNLFHLVSELFTIGPGLPGCSSQENTGQRGRRVTCFEVDPSEQAIIMALEDSSLSDMNPRPTEKREVLQMVTNGSLFNSELLPVGQHMEAGIEQFKLNVEEGKGNFH